jgi:acyl phosphate:glycerol-3-phosphate acyltransferase
MPVLILFLAAFLLGSIPFGILMARAFQVKDLQSQGSGNIGATNVSRVAGFWPAGFLTFLFDCLKGAIATLVVSLPVFQSWWQTVWSQQTSYSGQIGVNTIWMVGFCAVLGHCFSPWVKFKGGKGVATGLGVIAVLTPIAALVGVLGFAFCFFKTKLGSLSSIVGLISTAIAYLVEKPSQEYGAYLWIGAALIALIVIRHESNIDSLLSGNERKF